MVEQYDIQDQVYPVGSAHYSMHDLLVAFSDPNLQINGLSRVSDFHFKVGDAVRYRLDDSLEVFPEGGTLTEDSLTRLLCPMLTEFQVKKFREEKDDIDVGFYWPTENINFRINAFYDSDGPAFVMRILPKSVPEVEKIGFPEDSVWRDIVQLHQGLVLVTGITGSGKTTTISSLLRYINGHRKARVITLEDPIEYHYTSNHALISQREVGTHLKSFAAGLRSAMRENPDIILVGEIRDLDTASLALSAAETGHLVFSTLHTRDARGALSRIINMVPGDRSRELAAQLSFSLRYVISQKLIPRTDGRGRVPAMEVLRNTSSVANMIRTSNWAQIYSALETKRKEGMNTLEQHLIQLCETGEISREDAIAHANDPVIIDRLGK